VEKNGKGKGGTLNTVHRNLVRSNLNPKKVVMDRMKNWLWTAENRLTFKNVPKVY
jgi:hypothetical protein